MAQRIPNNALLLSFATVASALSVISILDYPELPFDTVVTSAVMSSIFNGLLLTMSSAGYVGLFILMFLENLSLPIPSEVFLPMAGFFVFEGKMTFPAALGVSTLAGLAGSIAAYYLALVLGRPLVYGLAQRVGVGQGTLAKSEQWLNGKGSLAILISRFVPGIRSSISLPAGALRMNLARFFIMTLIGSFGWSAILMYTGYSGGPLWQSSSAAFFNDLIQSIPYIVIVASAFYIFNYVRNAIFTTRLKESRI